MHRCLVHGEKKGGTGSNNANSIEDDLADINNLIAMDIGEGLNQQGLPNCQWGYQYQDHPGKEYSPPIVSGSSTSLSINR